MLEVACHNIANWCGFHDFLLVVPISLANEKEGLTHTLGQS